MNDNSSYGRIIGKGKISDAYYLAESLVYILSPFHSSPSNSVLLQLLVFTFSDLVCSFHAAI